MMMIVSYDVSTTTSEGRRRLRQVAKACQNFGQRVQDSVFECVVDPEQWTRLRLRLLDIHNADEDSLRFYHMGNHWKQHVEHRGAKKPLELDGPLVA
jgi:CRISPR-associated protein Cas2